MRDDTTAAKRWLRSRRLYGGVALQLILAGAVAVWGQQLVEVPSGTPGGSVLIGMWVLVPAASGSAVGVALSSELSEWDQAAARLLWSWDVLYAAALLVTAGLLFLAASLLSSASATAPAGLRNLAFFTGLALLSGRLFQRHLSWSLPLAALLPMAYFGYDATNAPLWWALPLRPVDPATTAGAVGLLATGLAAVVVSPWTLRRALAVVRARPW